jgi:hypothetical protein
MTPDRYRQGSHRFFKHRFNLKVFQKKPVGFSLP